jgi:hypothetical protein
MSKLKTIIKLISVQECKSIIIYCRIDNWLN